MSTASPVDVAVNPNNTAQRYIFWGNGRIDAIGGAVPITDQKTWYDRFEPPGVAIHVTNWTTGAGYTLDYRGGFNPFGGAPALGVTASEGPKIGVPEVAGVPVTTSGTTRRYVDWSWDPAGTGQGYVLDQYGQLSPFGGATPPPRTGPRVTTPRMHKLAMQWTPTKRAMTLDGAGYVHGDFGATVSLMSGTLLLRGISTDLLRDFVVTDWTTGSGLVLDRHGAVHTFGTEVQPFGYPWSIAANSATLAIINPADPRRFWQVWGGGQQFEWVSSTPPTVVAGGTDPVSPASTVTGTTRPILSWDYNDPQGDSQTGWELYVFTSAFASGHDMTNPAKWDSSATVKASGNNQGTRGLASPVDLPNGAYRMYVRAKDSAEMWSAWSNRTWTQNIPVPTTPTGMTATANYTDPVAGASLSVQGPDGFSVTLTVSATTGQSADLIRFECSDDGGTTWASVRGASALAVAATVTAIDWDAPLGKTRLYRARAYANDPAVVSDPSTTASATVPLLTYVLTSAEDATVGGRILVQEPISWTRRNPGGVFEGLDADYPTVVSGGTPRGLRTTLNIYTPNEAAWDLVESLLNVGGDLVYRDPLGHVRYCRVVGDATQALMAKAALRHEHTVDIPLIEIRPPQLEA